uniref:Uncharacterized protein n=1 Tax=Scleropages formosus TaxID=113540 RepID=A0A8C9QSI3_SCLFO
MRRRNAGHFCSAEKILENRKVEKIQLCNTRAKSVTFVGTLRIHSCSLFNLYMGILGIQVKIMLPWYTSGHKKPLSYYMSIMEQSMRLTTTPVPAIYHVPTAVTA